MELTAQRQMMPAPGYRALFADRLCGPVGLRPEPLVGWLLTVSSGGDEPEDYWTVSGLYLEDAQQFVSRADEHEDFICYLTAADDPEDWRRMAEDQLARWEQRHPKVVIARWEYAQRLPVAPAPPPC